MKLNCASRGGFTVEEVELPFLVELYEPATGELLEDKLIGSIDLVIHEGGRRILVEHKSSARRWGVDQLQHDVQLAAYQMAARQLGITDVGLRYEIVTKAKEPALQVVEVTRSHEAEDDFRALAAGVLKAIDAGVSFPIRGTQCTSCAYAAKCSERRAA